MNYEKSLFNTTNKIWNRIQGQIIGLVSFAIFRDILKFTPQFEISIIIVFSSMFFLGVEKYLKFYCKTEKNKFFDLLIIESIDFLYALSIFLIVQYINFYTDRNNPLNLLNLIERLVVTLLQVLFILSIVRTFKLLEISKNNEESHTIVVVWDRIFGVFVEIFSLSVSRELLVFNDKNLTGLFLLTISAIYMMFDIFLRNNIYSIQHTKTNSDYSLYVLDFLDFCFVFAFFLPLSYFTQTINSNLSSIFYSKQEQALLLILLIISIIYVFTSFFGMYSETNKWGLVKTTIKLWPRISGALSSILSIGFSKLINNNSFQYIVFISGLFLYLLMDPYVREYIVSKQKNKNFSILLLELLDFLFGFIIIFTITILFNVVSINNNSLYYFSEKLLFIFLSVSSIWFFFISNKFFIIQK